MADVAVHQVREAMSMEDGAQSARDFRTTEAARIGSHRARFIPALVAAVLATAVICKVAAPWPVLPGFNMMAPAHPALDVGARKGSTPLAPLLGDGTAVDWWFAFKLTSKAFPSCSTHRSCMFGGVVQSYEHGFGLQYLLGYGSGGQTTPLALHTDCLGSGADPVAQTFQQVWGGVPNFVIWNDQLYQDPQPHIKPQCGSDCAAPWGHSKGVMAWDEDGTGFVMQVSTPDWPGNGNSEHHRAHEGNTLGCIKDDDIEVAQHFFALRLATADDTRTVLQALQHASVVTDPSSDQLMKLSSGPSDLASLAQSLGRLSTETSPFQGTLSVKTGSGNQVQLIAKPNSLHVPPWQMVSALTGTGLRTATWWASPKIPSTKAGTPGCWASGLSTPGEVQVATSGQWGRKTFSLEGRADPDANHAKIGHSLTGSLAIFGDMNQQGAYTPSATSDGCTSSQNGRGGLFFVLDDQVMHDGLHSLLTGDTAPYSGGRGPSPPSPPGPSRGDCGGQGVPSSTCRSKTHSSDCAYVSKSEVELCGVEGWGCFALTSLKKGCPAKPSNLASVAAA